MHTNASWAGGLIRYCYEQGVREFCIAPGSRSAPLAIACFHAKTYFPDIRLHTHYDERGLGFFALGLVRVGDAPVVVITTSGTAVANVYPAVVEAWQTCQPLWVMSADRPDSLLGCGANQAIQQKDLFGINANFSVNLTRPTNPQAWRGQVAMLAELGGTRGPAQLNCQFDEPLYQQPEDYLSGLAQPIPVVNVALEQAQHSVQTTGQKTVQKTAQVQGLRAFLQSFELSASASTIVVLGALSPGEADILGPWLRTLKCPIFADIGSQFRFGALPNVIAHADLLLLKPAEVKPNRILQLGGRIVSKRINRWLPDAAENYFLLDQNNQKLDPSGKSTQYHVNYSEFVKYLPGDKLVSPVLQQLLGSSEALGKRISAYLKGQWHEAVVCQQVMASIEGRVALMPGNSLSIRMLDSYSTQTKAQILVYANRGASGIDGLLATAAALAHGQFDYVVAVIGDTSLLHDINSLSLLSKSPLPVKLLVLNNDGGQIFATLAAAQQEGFNALFAMPHGLEFSHACAQFSLEYRAVHTTEEFQGQCKAWLNSANSSVLECRLLGGAEPLKHLVQRLSEPL